MSDKKKVKSTKPEGEAPSDAMNTMNKENCKTTDCKMTDCKQVRIQYKINQHCKSRAAKD